MVDRAAIPYVIDKKFQPDLKIHKGMRSQLLNMHAYGKYNSYYLIINLLVCFYRIAKCRYSKILLNIYTLFSFH